MKAAEVVCYLEFILLLIISEVLRHGDNKDY